MFEYYKYLSLTIIVLLLLILFFISYKLSKKQINGFVNKNLWNSLLNVNFKLILLKNICFIIALLFVVFALARPKWGLKQIEAKSLSSDIVIALDVSKSMLAQDLKPDRLSRAKMVFKDLTK